MKRLCRCVVLPFNSPVIGSSASGLSADWRRATEVKGHIGISVFFWFFIVIVTYIKVAICNEKPMWKLIWLVLLNVFIFQHNPRCCHFYDISENNNNAHYCFLLVLLLQLLKLLTDSEDDTGTTRRSLFQLDQRDHGPLGSFFKEQQQRSEFYRI